MSVTDAPSSTPGSKGAILSAALSLSLEERAEIATRLLQSLDLKPHAPGTDSEPGLIEEIERRVDAFESGRMEAIPWRDAIEQARKSLHADHVR